MRESIASKSANTPEFAHADEHSRGTIVEWTTVARRCTTTAHEPT